MIMNSRSGRTVDVEHKFHIEKQSFFRWSKRVNEKNSYYEFNWGLSFPNENIIITSIQVQIFWYAIFLPRRGRLAPPPM